MTIEFVNKHDSCGFDVTQDGRIIAGVRYGKIYGYVAYFEDDVNLDIEELDQILAKMKELSSKQIKK